MNELEMEVLEEIITSHEEIKSDTTIAEAV